MYKKIITILAFLTLIFAFGCAVKEEIEKEEVEIEEIQEVEEIQYNIIPDYKIKPPKACFYSKNNTKICIKLYIADTDEERKKGLSGKESLGEYEGMLFVFDEPKQHTFWAMDMKFPIDLLFIDENFRILAIQENEIPCINTSNCSAYTAPKPLLYAIEVNAGFTAKHSIRTDISRRVDTEVGDYYENAENLKDLKNG